MSELEFEEIQEVLKAVEDYTEADDEGIFIDGSDEETVEKKWKFGGGMGASSGLGSGGKGKGKGPGSRGGNYWRDANGKIRYGAKPKMHVGETKTKAKPKPAGHTSQKPHTSSSKSSSTGKPAHSTTTTAAKKPKDYRTTKTPQETLAHLDHIVRNGGLPGQPKLSAKDLDHLNFIATSMRDDLKREKQAKKESKTTKKVTLETAIEHLTDGTNDIHKISNNRQEIESYFDQLETLELKVYFLQKAVGIAQNRLQKEYYTEKLNLFAGKQALGFQN